MIRQLFRKKRGRNELLKLSDTVSELLRNIVIVLLVVILLSQFALQNETIRNWLTSADRWEGTPLS